MSTVAVAADPAHVGIHDSTPQDIDAIMQLTKAFGAAVSEKNVKKLSALMFDSNILFVSPASVDAVNTINQREDVNYTGVASGGYGRFAQFVLSSRGALEQKFSGIKITQDGHLAWVIFDFEFLQDSKVVNYGVEAWQVVKVAGGKWKILSVVWSSHGAPRQ
jgi:hypothetical protein